MKVKSIQIIIIVQNIQQEKDLMVKFIRAYNKKKERWLPQKQYHLMERLIHSIQILHDYKNFTIQMNSYDQQSNIVKQAV
ncbi:unnamed protein product [Paramecium sonneborni]|uniref:Uncharacterized protein n=1 Tax=Paramecium sonneborni TaxID=65129 RepID=A0A8S1PUR3_9CILI|nr:unnamed protein product [Paramecium sonneborni]